MARDYTSNLSDDSDLIPKHPTHRNFLVYCDESGIDGAQKYVGFGSLWLPWEGRGRLTGLINAQRSKYSFNDEIKWTGVSRSNVRFYAALVEQFFSTSWLAFHAIVVRKAVIDRTRHASRKEAFMKFFANLLANKIKRSAKLAPNRHYYVRVDPLPSSYKKADEAERNIIGSMLRQKLGQNVLEALDTRDSKRTPGIQPADLLLGGVMAAFQKEVTSQHKLDIMTAMASHLNWPNLFADTLPAERKFNVWYFHDKALGPREVKSREVRLKYPLPTGSFSLKVRR